MLMDPSLNALSTCGVVDPRLTSIRRHPDATETKIHHNLTRIALPLRYFYTLLAGLPRSTSDINTF
jgi:hypothetical protein